MRIIFPQNLGRSNTKQNIIDRFTGRAAETLIPSKKTEEKAPEPTPLEQKYEEISKEIGKEAEPWTPPASPAWMKYGIIGIVAAAAVGVVVWRRRG